MIRQALLTPNEYSRPQLKIRAVEAVVLHWVGNPQTTAEGNRRYFESLKDGSRKASAHYIIDAMEILRCVPDEEVAYHCGSPTGYTPWAQARWGIEHPNWYCLGIEHCHPDWSGRWEHDVILQSRLLCAGLCRKYHLDPEKDICLHWTITGKDCPRYFVATPAAFTEFKLSVKRILEE